MPRALHTANAQQPRPQAEPAVNPAHHDHDAPDHPDAPISWQDLLDWETTEGQQAWIDAQDDACAATQRPVRYHALNRAAVPVSSHIFRRDLELLFAPESDDSWQDPGYERAFDAAIERLDRLGSQGQALRHVATDIGWSNWTSAEWRLARRYFAVDEIVTRW